MKDDARIAIQTAVNAAWAIGPTPCLLTWDNQPKNHEPKAPWARASILYGTTIGAALGPNFTRTTAILQIQVFIPEGEGTAIATTAADRSDDALQFQTVQFTTRGKPATITGDQGCTGPNPAGLDGGFQQYNLTHTLRIDVAKF